MAKLNDKVIVITGGTRGIGLAIGKRCAQDGAKVALLGKTTDPTPKLEGTLFTAAEEVIQAGGEALPLKTDIRFEEEIQTAIDQVVEKWGKIDILINNASAIFLESTLKTPMKRFDLMFGVNVRGTFATTQACLPHLLKAPNPHVLMLSPPLNMKAQWFQNHCAYTMSKYGMSQCVLGMAEEFKSHGVAFNALWPQTVIATAAINMLGGEALMKSARHPSIVADAAYWILTQESRACTGNFFLDEEVLEKAGITDLSNYAMVPGAILMPDFFLD
jgi:citronellol/citronellal dehydrogenase